MINKRCSYLIKLLSVSVFVFFLIEGSNAELPVNFKFKNIAIIGDSGATGVAADPRVGLDANLFIRSTLKATNLNQANLGPYFFHC
jgi:hypothetical protein